MQCRTWKWMVRSSSSGICPTCSGKGQCPTGAPETIQRIPRPEEPVERSQWNAQICMGYHPEERITKDGVPMGSVGHYKQTHDNAKRSDTRWYGWCVLLQHLGAIALHGGHAGLRLIEQGNCTIHAVDWAWELQNSCKRFDFKILIGQECQSAKQFGGDRFGFFEIDINSVTLQGQCDLLNRTL